MAAIGSTAGCTTGFIDGPTGRDIGAGGSLSAEGSGETAVVGSGSGNPISGNGGSASSGNGGSASSGNGSVTTGGNGSSSVNGATSGAGGAPQSGAATVGSGGASVAAATSGETTGSGDATSGSAMTSSGSGTVEGVLFADDFESGSFDETWSTVWLDPNAIMHSSDQAHGGNYSIRLHYADIPDALTRGEGAATDRNFDNTHHIFIRYWFMISPDFVTSNISTKWMYGPRSTDSLGAAGPGCLLVTVGAPVPYLGCQSMFYPDGYYATPYDRQNGYSTGPAQEKGVWTCYEYEVDVGTLNNADGVMRLWKNDELLGELTDLPLFVEGVGHFNNIAFYQERGIGDLYYDDLVIATQRIGCNGSPP